MPETHAGASTAHTRSEVGVGAESSYLSPSHARTGLQSFASSVAEKAKLAAWNNKRGLSQEDAMLNYIQECE